ncbi:uncharacterized protein F4807DRAFT_227126 [Annulohypoxylon truncatum]|uniref:uncharacterized protein n=1 Tax=Annulohypoxylon truncatum TaxID=327061 RepID=UPI00200772E0|nr:uncharacterized protein F4807DRAFT_227126 [Annulohypoxylon truncatum]KAI1206610.1 hypothetical protein F4807DRAFT_227126 [Annulohypoxylon truncatum]
MPPSNKWRSKSSLPRTVWETARKAYRRVSRFQRPVTGPVIFLLDLLPRRLPEENVRRPGHNKPFSLVNRRGNQNLLALCVQIGGRLHAGDQRCAQCKKGSGLWKECVTAPIVPNRNTDLTNGACACCYYNGGGSLCSFVATAIPPKTTASSRATQPFLPTDLEGTWCTQGQVDYMDIYKNMTNVERQRAQADLQARLGAL